MRVLIYDEMYKFMNKYYRELGNLVALKLANSAMVALNLIASRGNFKEYKEKYYKVTGILNKYFNKTIKLDNYPNTVKILLAATKIHPLSYKILVNLVAKRG